MNQQNNIPKPAGPESAPVPEKAPQAETSHDIGKVAVRAIDYDEYCDEEPHFEKIKRGPKGEARHPNNNQLHKEAMREQAWKQRHPQVFDFENNALAKQEYRDTPKPTAEKLMERALDVANRRLEKHAEEYYVEGAVEAIAEGKLFENPRYIKDGFLTLEKESIDRKVPEESREEFWDAFLYGEMLDKVDEWKVQPEAIKKAETEAVIEAVARGAELKRGSLDEEPELKLNLPIKEHGADGSLVAFIERYTTEENVDEIRTNSIIGFSNIIEAIKDGTSKNTEDGFAALDWYVDNFDYKGSSITEFKAIIDGIRQAADAQWQDKYAEYLEHNKEFAALLEKEQEHEDNRDEQEKRLIATAQLVSDEEWQEFCEGAGTGEIFPDGSGRPGMSGAEFNGQARVKYATPSVEEKKTMAVQEINRIREEVDPYATIYRCKVFETGSSDDNDQYVVVRFGCNGHNNVIAVPISGESRATFSWSGETGEDAEGWRAFFLGTIKDRSAEVNRHTLNGYTKQGQQAFDNMWNRIYKRLKVPLKAASGE